MKVNVIRAAILMGLFALCLSSANATILYDSELTAPPLVAGNLVGQDGWANHSGTASFIQVGATGTTVAHGSGSREDANVSFTPISSGEIYYFGFDASVSGGTTDVYFAHFKDAGTSNFVNRVFISAPNAGGDFTFGIGTGSAPSSEWASDFTFNSVNRIVGSYTQGTNEIRLWINPSDISDTSLSATAPATTVSSFALRQAGGNSTQVVSNLIVATTFNEAAGIIPEPTTISLMLVSVGAMLFRRK